MKIFFFHLFDLIGFMSVLFFWWLSYQVDGWLCLFMWVAFLLWTQEVMKSIKGYTKGED